MGNKKGPSVAAPFILCFEFYRMQRPWPARKNITNSVNFHAGRISATRGYGRHIDETAAPPGLFRLHIV